MPFQLKRRASAVLKVRERDNMSKVVSEARCYLPITAEDLKRLAEVARRDRETFFKKHPDWARFYQGRVLCVALCQGSALHYVDGKTGINDFDVWTFYRANPKKSWCYRRNVPYDYGDDKFGKSVDCPDFVGRRVDCLGRDIEASKSDDATSALRRYLSQHRTKTARELAKKAVVLLEPDLGKVVWQPQT
jgi:hypothetical protein